MPVEYTADEIRRMYDEVAPNYERMNRVANRLGFNRYRQRLFQQASGAVLEVAVGTGENLPYYPPDCRITAIDLSEEMLRIAYARAASLGLDATFQVMDAERLDVPDGSFDCVTSSLSSCTFPNPVAALGEMRRVCKPDGRVLLLEHGRSRVGVLGRLQDRLEVRHSRFVGCHWNREPHELVAQAGLTIVRHRRAYFGVLHLIEARP